MGILVLRKSPVVDNAPLFDTFNGSSVDTSIWTVYNRDGDRVNGDVNVVRPQNAVVSGGALGILVQYSSGAYPGYDSADNTTITRDYASAQIASKQSWLYGTFDARIKTAGGAGVGPLFWMLGDGWKASQPTTANVAGHNWPADTGGWWEIDIMEFPAGTRTSNHCAAHVNTSNTTDAALPFNANSRYMVYRLDWRAGWLRWYVDAEDGNGFVLLNEITTSSNIPTTPGYIMCHAELDPYYGTQTPGDYPVTVLFDWVRVTT